MKVCILAAGLGTRSGPVGGSLHKALFPLGNRAVLSHIFEKFPKDTQFVLAVGHKASQIEAFVRLVHPDLDVKFVPVDPYVGPGAGPGRSLFACREQLQAPFIFTACDTLILDDLPSLDENWLGVTEVSDPERWCTVSVDEAMRIKSLTYKSTQSKDRYAFTGIAFIKDYDLFWRGIEEGIHDKNSEIQVNPGLSALTTKELHARPVSWADTGEWESYKELAKRFTKNFSFMGKTTETTYAYGDSVVKLYSSEEKAAACGRRGMEMKGCVPEVQGVQGPFLRYRFVEGALLSRSLNGVECENFLNWMEANFWKPAEIEPTTFRQASALFYVDKTLARVKQFESTGPDARFERKVVINGLECLPADKLVRLASQTLTENGLPSTFHGDLHADNVLVTSNGYRLIDWRDGFNDLEVGDRYYDLAKFLHTMDFSVESMEKRTFCDTWSGEELTFSHRCEFREILARDAFREFVIRKGYDQERIDLINAVIFLNMSPLYDRELGSHLYWMGRYLLQCYANQAL